MDILKLFTLILSLYVLLLTGIPCCAFDKCESDNVRTEHKDSKQKPEKEKGCDNCSPFFSCHSCSGFVVEQALSFEHSSPTYMRVAFTGYKLRSYPQYIVSVWQPPQLARIS